MVSWHSARRNWRRFAELPSQERVVLLQAAILLPLVALGRRVVSLKRLQALLARLIPGQRRTLDADVLHSAQAAARMVQIAARHGVVRANCLERSLVLWGLLRRQGIDTDLRIGVRKDGDQFESHAWVEYQGTVLNDSDDVGERFVVLTEVQRAI